MPPESSPIDANTAVTELLRLFRERPHGASPADARRRLRERLTVSPPGSLPPAAWPLLEALWSMEARDRTVTHAMDLPRLAAEDWGARASVWRGDITSLAIDAIVNAANSGLTGCYQPLHACVDNAIHTAAGPWLREECGQIMDGRARPEPTSTATLTKGYHLPASHVIHTVGPIVRGHAPGPEDERALRRCYTVCLEIAASGGLSSVAFCGISSGLFGYPPALAAPVAIAAVRDFLRAHRSIHHVVFVAYSPSDHALYQKATQEALHAQLSNH